MIALRSLIIPSISSSTPLFHTNLQFPFKTQLRSPNSQSKLLLFAQNEQKQPNGSSSDLKEESNPIFNVKLGDLLLNPDPDNVVAVGLTGLLAWASAQVLWQLLIVSLAILVAAVKYCFIAALLVFILITLL